MVSYSVPWARQTFSPSLVVTPADELAGVPAPDDHLVPCPARGLGIIEKLARSGQVRVRWMDA